MIQATPAAQARGLASIMDTLAALESKRQWSSFRHFPSLAKRDLSTWPPTEGKIGMARRKTVPFDGAETEGKGAAVVDGSITSAVQLAAATLSLTRTAEGQEGET